MAAAVAKCPIAEVSKIIGDTWILLIIYTLLKSDMRFGEIQKALPDINSRTLTIRLKELEERGLVNRIQYTQIPPKVVYSLTPKGRKMEKLMSEIQVLSDSL